MGAAASSSEFQDEIRKPGDGSDLADLDFEGMRQELTKLREKLYKFAEDSIPNGVKVDGSDVCTSANAAENRAACLKEILYVREMIRMTSNTSGRRMRRKASMQAMKELEEAEAAEAAAAARVASSDDEERPETDEEEQVHEVPAAGFSKLCIGGDGSGGGGGDDDDILLVSAKGK
eukprot:g3004.t1